jgi:ankyrin repeat protein
MFKIIRVFLYILFFEGWLSNLLAASFPLIDCLKNGETNLAAMMILAKSNINVVDEKGLTPLHIACKEGYENIAMLLISNHAEIRKDAIGATPLHYAAAKSLTNVAEILLKKGVGIDDTTDAKWLNIVPGNSTSLHFATLRCTYEGIGIIPFLIQHGADPNAENESGMTPLLYAAYNNRPDLVRELLENGADPDHLFSGKLRDIDLPNSCYHATALDFATRFGYSECCRYLIEKTDLSKCSLFPEKIYLALVLTGDTNCVKEIAAKGIDINYRDDNGLTALYWAVISKKCAMIKFLLELGVDRNVELKRFGTVKVMGEKKMRHIDARPGDTAYDIAQKIGDRNIINSFN